MDNHNIQQYLNKKVQFFPNDTYYKEGYIIDVDDIGITYEVTNAYQHRDCGTFFINHACKFVFKVIAEDK